MAERLQLDKKAWHVAGLTISQKAVEERKQALAAQGSDEACHRQVRGPDIRQIIRAATPSGLRSIPGSCRDALIDSDKHLEWGTSALSKGSWGCYAVGEESWNTEACPWTTAALL